MFRSTPSEIVFAFSAVDGGPQRGHVAATPPPGLFLDKLGRLGELIDELEAGIVAPNEIGDRVDALDRRPLPYGVVTTTVGYGCVGAGLAVILRGAPVDVVVATALAVVVAAIVILSPKVGKRATEWLPFTTAFVRIRSYPAAPWRRTRAGKM